MYNTSSKLVFPNVAHLAARGTLTLQLELAQLSSKDITGAFVNHPYNARIVSTVEIQSCMLPTLRIVRKQTVLPVEELPPVLSPQLRPGLWSFTSVCKTVVGARALLGYLLPVIFPVVVVPVEATGAFPYNRECAHLNCRQISFMHGF